VLYTNDVSVANTEAFVAPLKKPTAVWFVGGRHWRIADAYLNTLTQKELFAFLARRGAMAVALPGRRSKVRIWCVVQQCQMTITS
jgi:cyanophycinase-like exopeptidase